MSPDARVNFWRGTGIALGVILLLLALWGVWRQADLGTEAQPPDAGGVTTTAPATTAPSGEAAGTTFEIPNETGTEQIQAVQERLNALGYDAGTVDGAAGPKFSEALTSFQTANGLDATGELDEKTIAALESADAKSASGSDSSDSTTTTTAAS